MKYFTLLAGLIACIACTAPIEAQAQGSSSSTRQSSSKRPTVRFCVWGKWTGKEIFIKSSKGGSERDKKYLKLDLLNMGYSPKYPFKKGTPLYLFTHELVDEEMTYSPLLQVKVPPSTKSPLVLIFQNENGVARYKVFDIHPSEFQYGDYQFVNLSKAPLLAKLDKKSVKLNPNKSVILAGSTIDGSNMWLRVAAKKNSTETKLVYSSMLKNRKSKRMFIFFYPNDNIRNPIGVKTLVDFAPL